MRASFAAAVLVSIACAGSIAARADAPPAGTVRLELVEGGSAPIQVPAGANVVCDDLEIARPELRDEHFAIVAGHAGETLCGVRYGGLPRGAYLVVVKAKPPKR